MGESVYAGNAGRDAGLDRGWLLGHFREVGDPRHSTDVEIKWGVHPKGDERALWVTGEARTALLVLISGRFRVRVPGRDVLLAEQGDYVVWGKGVDHSWFAEEESVVLTVRWPSVPGYAVRAEDAGDASGGEAEVAHGDVEVGEAGTAGVEA
ncbi:signal peptidase I [Streptacidiphilus cavernicola]|uniref:Signal peptidase I n=1 Tax=Streptacidiphilus cavernicola TaxID=3342716 RepID=A0ABV6W1F8_9ACTN